MTDGRRDGAEQRNALTAAEQAIRALGRGDSLRAAANAQRAGELDHTGRYADLVVAVAVATTDLDARGTIRDESWDRVADAVGPGPLAFLVADQRS